jgi:RHS repeat-associated protein
MNYVGIDIHKRYSVLAAQDGEGRKLKEARIEGNKGGGLRPVLPKLGGTEQGGFRSGFNGCRTRIRPDGTVDLQAWGHVATRYGYDGRGIVSSILHTNTAAGRNLARRDYWRDDRDRIRAWKRGIDNSLNGMEDGRGDRYQYDPEGQLKIASYRVANPEGSPGVAVRTDIFHYDELGNRVRGNHVASRGEMLFERRDNKLNQYDRWNNSVPPLEPGHWGSGIFHDDNWSPWWLPPGNGVTIADGWITASYNALNQPVAMGNIAYGSNRMWFWYDPLGRCVKRWIGTLNQTVAGPTTYFYYDGWNLIQEGTSATTADRIYVHGNRVDEIVASLAGVGWLYHHYDARGHCILLTNAGGGLQEQYDYDAFGWPYFYTAAGESVPQAPSGNRFLFTGREFLADMRIYDYRNRMYQPELGRFLQPGPKEFAAGDYNLYRYCHNDPVNRADPFGLRSQIVVELLKKLFQAPIRVTGGTYGERKEMRREVKRGAETPRGKELVKMIKDRGDPVTLHVTKENSAHSDQGPGGKNVYVDPKFHPQINTTKGIIPASTVRIIFHELGHAVAGAGGAEQTAGAMDNVMQNENPVANALVPSEPSRINY